MKHIFVRAGILLFVCVALAFGQARLQHAADEFKAGKYEDARATLKSLLYTPGEEQEGALYLLLRVEIAEKNSEAALSTAERLLSMFPRGEYSQYAHFARAEALFLHDNRTAAIAELEWVRRNGSDPRLLAEAMQAESLLKGGVRDEASEEELVEEFEAPPETGEYELSEGRIALLLSFPDPEDAAAADLQRGFRFASDYGNLPFPATITRATSPYEAVSAARDLMKDEDLVALMFAGDDGSGMAISLLSREYGVPVIKLNTSARSFTEFSPYLFEFLPGTETQARELGQFATETLGNDYALILAPEDEEGRANRDGFTKGVLSVGGTVDAVATYPPAASTVRPELADIFSAEPRIARGESPIRTLLSREEREALFGDEEAGEVLEDTPEPAPEDTITSREAFFFALRPEHIDDYASQLTVITKRTTLFGNSGWIDAGALEQQAGVTEGMYVVAPLVPSVADTNEYARRYSAATGEAPGPWELLGIDAGEYAGRLMSATPKSRREMMQLIEGGERFDGLALIVEFDGKQENKFARILKLEEGILRTVR